jgi:prephenate dehydrogenase
VFDADPAVRARRRSSGSAPSPSEDLATTVADVDLVVVATPAHTVPDVVEEVARLVAPGTFLTDAASLKSDLTLEVESRLRSHLP